MRYDNNIFFSVCFQQLVQVESSCLVAGMVSVLMDFKGMDRVFVTQDTLVWLVKDATHPSVQV